MGWINFRSFRLSTRKIPLSHDRPRRFDVKRWVTLCLQKGYTTTGQAAYTYADNRTLRRYMMKACPDKLQKILDRAWIWHHANYMYTEDGEDVYKYMVPYWTPAVEWKYFTRLAIEAEIKANETPETQS